MIKQYQQKIRAVTTAMPDSNRSSTPYPDLLTENELVSFLRIHEISNSQDHHNVIEHLKRYRNLPRIHLCNKTLYPLNAILKWIEKETIYG